MEKGMSNRSEAGVSVIGKNTEAPLRCEVSCTAQQCRACDQSERSFGRACLCSSASDRYKRRVSRPWRMASTSGNQVCVWNEKRSYIISILY
ncbi:hypothetical protein T06_8506 [Trichinella sp. T6]|nr:hypothetical protein T06_8506 [Trichinella sp. T6]